MHTVWQPTYILLSTLIAMFSANNIYLHPRFNGGSQSKTKSKTHATYRPIHPKTDLSRGSLQINSAALICTKFS